MKSRAYRQEDKGARLRAVFAALSGAGVGVEAFSFVEMDRYARQAIRVALEDMDEDDDAGEAALLAAATVGRQAARKGWAEADLASWFELAHRTVFAKGMEPLAAPALHVLLAAMLKAFRQQRG